MPTQNRFTTTTKNRQYQDTYIILNAGISRTMRSLDKCLLMYGTKTIIDNQISVIRSMDKSADIIVVCNNDDKSITSHIKNNYENIRIVYNDNKNSGSCLSIKYGISASILSNIYIIHGDIIFSKSIISGVDKNNISIPIINSTSNSRGVSYYDHKFDKLEFGQDNTWCQCVYFPATLYNQLINCLAKEKTSSYSTSDLVNLLAKKFPITTYNCNKSVYFEIINKKDVE